MKDLLLVLVGGLCSAFGGFFAAWYRARTAGTIRLKETIAERRVAAYGKGLELIEQLQSVLIQGIAEDSLKFVESHGRWFADNRILLPPVFVENWRSIRLNLHSAIQENPAQEKMADGADRDTLINHVGQLRGFCDELAREAEASIRNELDLPECRIRHLQNRTLQLGCRRGPAHQPLGEPAFAPIAPPWRQCQGRHR